jgi:hypothetical protein
MRRNALYLAGKGLLRFENNGYAVEELLDGGAAGTLISGKGPFVRSTIDRCADISITDIGYVAANGLVVPAE